MKARVTQTFSFRLTFLMCFVDLVGSIPDLPKSQVTLNTRVRVTSNIQGQHFLYTIVFLPLTLINWDYCSEKYLEFRKSNMNMGF